MGRSLKRGDSVYFQTALGHFLDVRGTSVQARSSDPGTEQTFVIEGALGPGPVRSGDAVRLRAASGAYLGIPRSDRNATAVARSSAYGDVQVFVIEASELKAWSV